MEPKSKLAGEKLKAALKSQQAFTDAEIDEIVFHLLDWIEDLRPFVEFLENPARHQDGEINKLIVKLLIHAPDHLQAAAAKMFEAAERESL